MPVYKDKARGTWYVVTRYKDWTGKLRTTTKRGFKSKVEAKRYEVEFAEKKDNSLSMTFGSFVEIYMDSMEKRLKKIHFRRKWQSLKEDTALFQGQEALRDNANRCNQLAERDDEANYQNG